jgi:hypothetical protein
MLIALEEMPPHTVYQSVLSELSSYPAIIDVWRCDHLPGGAYALSTERLSPTHDGIPRYWRERDDFLLDLGYRGVQAEMVWFALDRSSACDRPAIAESLRELRERLEESA